MTKFNLKTLAVAIALAAVGSQANAAMITSQGIAGDGNSSVILYAYSSLLGRSYSRDLGIKLNDFLYNGTTAPGGGSYAFTPPASSTDATNTNLPVIAGNANTPGYSLMFGSDNVMKTWLGNGSTLASDVQWGIAAVDGTGSGSAFRALTTVQVGGSSAGTTNSELATFENKFDNFVAAHNFGAGYLVPSTHFNTLGNGGSIDQTIGNGSSGSDGSNSAASNAATGFGVNWTNAASFFSAGGVGQSMEFYFLAQNGILGSAQVTSARYANTAGNSLWTLNADSSLTYAASAVPVPAAVWLFASGLMGLVGISRRKKSA